MKCRLLLPIALLLSALGCKSGPPGSNPWDTTVPPPGSGTEAPLYNSSAGAPPYYNPAPGQTIGAAPTGAPGYPAAEGAVPTTPPPVSTPTGPTAQPGGTFDFRSGSVTPGGATQVASHEDAATAAAAATLASRQVAVEDAAPGEIRTRRGTRIRVVEPGSLSADRSGSATAANTANTSTGAGAQEPRRIDTAAAPAEAVDIMRLPPIERSAPTVRQANNATTTSRERG